MEAKHTQNINNTSAWHEQNHQGPVKFLCYCFVLPSSKNKTLWFAETRHNKIEISKAQKFVIRAIPNWFLPDQFSLGDTGCCTSYCTLLSQLCRGLLGQASFQLEGEKGRPNGVTDFWETSPPSPGWHQRRLGWQRWLQCFIGGAHCCANSWQSLTNDVLMQLVLIQISNSIGTHCIYNLHVPWISMKHPHIPGKKHEHMYK